MVDPPATLKPPETPRPPRATPRVVGPKTGEKRAQTAVLPGPKAAHVDNKTIKRTPAAVVPPGLPAVQRMSPQAMKRQPSGPKAREPAW